MLKRTVITLFVCALGIGVAFVATEYVRDEFIARQLDPESGIRWYRTLVDVVFFGAIALSAMLAIVVYLALAFREESKAAARSMLKDVVKVGSQFKTLYEMSPVPYFLVTPDGTIEEPNKAMLRLAGGEVKHIEGKALHDFLSSSDATHVDGLFKRFEHGVAVADDEVAFKRLDGKERDVLFSLFHIDNGTRRGWGLGTLVDITERKEIERAKTAFVSLAAHQLRTPISTIKWYTEMLASPDAGTLNEKQARYAAQVNTGANNMNELVHTLLNVSRLEMGTLPVAYESFDVAALVDGILEEVGVEAAQKRIVIEKHYSVSGNISTDPKLLRIVLQNLLSNAVKYTPEGGTVSAFVEGSGRNIEFRVVDTGFGIPPEAQDKIFTKLYRAPNAVQKVPGGNGLGLFMSKEIVGILGGTIRFTSELDRGTTFIVRIPQRSA